MKMEDNVTMDLALDLNGILQQGLAERYYGADDDNFNGSDSHSWGFYSSLLLIYQKKKSHSCSPTSKIFFLLILSALFATIFTINHSICRVYTVRFLSYFEY